MAIDLSNKPNILFLASLERIQTARQLVDGSPPDYAFAAYAAGLAVESILQAIALHVGQPHDVHHTLDRWLSKCPLALHDELRQSPDWNVLVALWSNSLRYLSFGGLLGYLREKQADRGIRGGPESMVRYNVNRVIAAAEVVHVKGLVQWRKSIKN